MDESEFRRALVVCAHPDDIDFGGAGTVATWTAAGIEVSYCMVTSGEAGGSDLSQSALDRAAIRHHEQSAAAEVVGVHDLHWLGHPDGAVVASLDLRRDITRVIRQVRPQVVVTQSPLRSLDFVYKNHPDHIATGEATACAVYPDARNPWAFPELRTDEGLEAWTVSELWILGGGSTSGVREQERFVDITDTFEAKMRALRSHASQGTDNPGIEDRMREWAQSAAKEAGWEPERLAERFIVVPTA